MKTIDDLCKTLWDEICSHTKGEAGDMLTVKTGSSLGRSILELAREINSQRPNVVDVDEKEGRIYIRFRLLTSA